jgi:quercetin dioxygenase-like cupin family protein
MLVPRRHCITIPHGSIAMDKHPSERFQDVNINILLHAKQDVTAFSFHEFEILPGGKIPIHIHQLYQETVYLLSGRAKMCSGGEMVTAGGGDFVSSAAGASIGVRPLGEEKVTGLVIFAPSYACDDYVWLDDEQFPADQAPPEDARF